MSTGPMALDFIVLNRHADQVARRTLRCGRSSVLEREDLRQELLLDLLRRLRHFDPARGSLGAFAATCFRHRAQRVLWVCRREARDRHAFSHHGQQATSGAQDAEVTLSLRLDLCRVLERLSPAQAATLAALLRHDGAGAAAPRTTRHRHLTALRGHLAAAGLREAA